jgi:hypothetical protein
MARLLKSLRTFNLLFEPALILLVTPHIVRALRRVSAVSGLKPDA